jgi:hypothetical protein
VFLKEKKILVRIKRAKRRNLIVKCCGRSSCSDVSFSQSERVSQVRRKKQDEAEFVNDLQYNKPKKKRKKSGSILGNLRAFGVLTDQGIHISCAGCPIGWPEMLTVYPEYEVGIPVTCSNCPNNWPGALNLLGIGGDQSWQQQPQFSGGGRGRGRGNNFFGYNANSNFGDRPAGPDYGKNFDGGNRGQFEDTEGDDDGADSPPLRRRPKTEGTSETTVTTVETTTEESTETTTEFILPEDRTTTEDGKWKSKF